MTKMETLTVVISGKTITAPLLDASEIPPRQRESKWRRKFNELPKGQAYKIEDKVVGSSARSQLYHFQRKGEFTRFKTCQRDHVTYIINPEDKGTTT